MPETAELLRSAGVSLDDLEAIAARFEAGLGYHRHAIKKRRGGLRIVFEASLETSSVLKQVRRALETAALYEPPKCVNGYVKGRSVLSNATMHLDRDVVLRIDLEDFFGSIKARMVERTLTASGLDAEGASHIARATTIDGSVPAGFSTSPWLSNIAFLDTDLALMALADDSNTSYSRFADDIVFSGSFDRMFLDEISSVVTAHGWTISDGKTRLMKRGGPQYVTGLYVGDKERPHVPRRVKRRLRQSLYYMEKYGFLDVHENYPGTAMYENQAAGWIRYLAHVEPRVAARLSAVFDGVDFADDYLYWGEPDDWQAILDEIGMAEGP